MSKVEENNNQEIDLIYLAQKIKEIFVNLGLLIFNVLRFFIKSKYILLLLIILGVISGFFYDKYAPVQYKTEVIVVPNFTSTDYLYSEIQNFSSNIPRNKKEKIFLEDILKIEIEPITDIKSFIENTQNREFLKILSENGQNFEKVLKDKNILKTNKYHLITITTKTNNYTKTIVDFLLEDLNKSKYYLDRSKLSIENLKESKIQLTKSIDQINVILDKLGTNDLKKGENDVSINNYDQLDLVIDLKKEYLEELLKIDTKIIESEKIIFPVNISFNNEPISKFYLKSKFVFPIILIVAFIFYSVLTRFYKKYAKISSIRNAR